jgi:hypothetical protein
MPAIHTQLFQMFQVCLSDLGVREEFANAANLFLNGPNFLIFKQQQYEDNTVFFK